MLLTAMKYSKGTETAAHHQRVEGRLEYCFGSVLINRVGCYSTVDKLCREP